MAAPDTSALMARQLVAKLAQMQPGGGQGAAPAGDQLSEQFSQLAGADPQMMLKALGQVKGMMVAMYGRTAMQIPEASRHIAQANKSIDSAIKSMQEAAATANVIGPSIQNNAGMSSPQPDSGMGGGGF